MRDWKRWALGALGALTIIGGLVYISQPVGHIPPYDANLVRLAESDLQGYCAGKTLLETGGYGDANMTAQCRSELAGKRSDKPNLAIVQSSFCQAIVDGGWEGTKSDCLKIMSDNEYWPTYDGSITNAWNRARPYPATFATIGGGSSSAGSRTGTSHGGDSSRSGSTQHTGGYSGPYGGP